MDIDVLEDLQSSTSEGGLASERRSSTEEIPPYYFSTEIEVDSFDDEDTAMEDTKEDEEEVEIKEDEEKVETKEDEEEVEAEEDSSVLIMMSSTETEEKEDPSEDRGGEECP